MSELQVDDLVFEVRRSDRRKTVQITVDRGGELILTAPTHTDNTALSDFVREKRFWIHKKLTEKAQLRRPMPGKHFINGEGFLYLGRSYRLKLVDDQDPPLKLVNGWFCLRRNNAADGRRQFIDWYSQRGREWLSGKVAEHAPRMEAKPTEVRVQDLGFRWGSCGKGDKVFFHWKTMLLPRPIAEYIVIHELAHLHVPHHTPAFWRRVERALPDYQRRKAWLAENGTDVDPF